MSKQVICRHRGDLSGSTQTVFGMEPQYVCDHPRHRETTIAECVVCPDFYLFRAPGQPDSSGCLHPPGIIVDRYGRDAAMADLYLGAQAFLVLGGPSLKSMPLEMLSRRGVLIMSVNNCPAGLPEGIRPHVWLHTDPTGKFHDSIWRDPGILKIVPVKEWKASNQSKKRGMRHRVGDEVVPWPEQSCRDQPGILGFHRNTGFYPERWLWEATINRGNDEQNALGMKKGKKVGEPNGWPKTINTMFAALRLAFYLGIKTLYLLGADFRMEDDAVYAFDQSKSRGGVRSNNSGYSAMNCMFDALLPHFQEVGFQVYNCTPGSLLWTFPEMSFEQAIGRATDSFEQTLNTKGWYDD